MKAVFVTPVYAPSLGGVQTLTARLARGLAEHGWEVSVITTDQWNPFRWYDQSDARLPDGVQGIDGITVRRLKARYAVVWRGLQGLCRLRVRGLYRCLRLVLGETLDYFEGPWIRSRDTLRLLRPDLLVLIWPYFRGAKDCLDHRCQHRIPLVVVPLLHVRCQSITGALRRLLAAADRVLVMTSMEKAAFVGAGLHGAKIDLLGCGVDLLLPEGRVATNPANRPGGALRVGYLGRLDAAKGVLDLLAAVGQLRARGRDVHLVLAGASGAFSERVRHAVREQVAADAGGVTFEENLSEERKAAVLEGLDMVVLPSVAESFGIVVLEAWVHRKPVIVCDDSPPACTVKEVGGGVCYTYGYPDELAAAIDRLGTEPELRRALGERGYEAVREHYTWDAIADKFRDQCNRAVLQAGRTKRP